MAKAVKERYGKPCMTMGNIRNPQVAEDILARGDACLLYTSLIGKVRQDPGAYHLWDLHQSQNS